MAVQWYEVFADALAGEPIVGVAQVVRRHVRREPTRSELHAARRAANRYADQGNAVTLHAPAGGARVLLLARLDANIPSDVDELRNIAEGRSAVATRRGAPRSERQVVDTIVRHVCSAGSAARRVDAGKLAGADAAAFAADLDQAIVDLGRLQRRLERRGHTDTSTR